MPDESRPYRAGVCVHTQTLVEVVVDKRYDGPRKKDFSTRYGGRVL
jgi:hypothetical protein